MKEASLVWHERFLDVNGEIIDGSTISIRRIITPISNTNSVNAQGVMIFKAGTAIIENIMALNPIVLDESLEDYELRIKDMLPSLLATSIPEFDFWMVAVGWDALITQAAGLLETFNRFDRI
jgi:hypothetical protein